MNKHIFSFIAAIFLMITIVSSCKKANTVVQNSETVPEKGALLNYYKTFDPQILNSGDEQKIKPYLDKKAKVIYNYIKTNYQDTICGLSDGKAANIILGGLVLAIHEKTNSVNKSLFINQSNSILRNNSAPSPSSQAMHCALFAVTGYDGVEKLLSGTTALMSGTEVLAILRSILKRYVGYVGIAIAVYEFGGCMGWYD
jgi:hypothetical protein